MISTAHARTENARTFETRHHRTSTELRCGEQFLVRLPEDPAIGFGWHANKTGGLQVIDSWFAPSDSPWPASGGFRYWRIKTAAAGRQFFRANYWRRDRTGNFPPIIFQIQVNVTV